MNTDFDILLAGAGHSHLGVLQRWTQRDRPMGRIGLVSAEPHAWYSGMMPGLVAERYQTRECRVPLPALCAAADVEFIQGTLVALRPDTPGVLLATGVTLRSTWLSLNLGSLPALPEQSGDGMELLSVKPFADFIRRWQQWEEAPEPVAVLGGGAAGVELALAIAAQAREVSLFSAGELLATHPPRLRRLALAHLQRAGVAVHEQTTIQAVQGNTLIGGWSWRPVRGRWNGCTSRGCAWRATALSRSRRRCRAARTRRYSPLAIAPACPARCATGCTPYARPRCWPPTWARRPSASRCATITPSHAAWRCWPTATAARC